MNKKDYIFVLIFLFLTNIAFSSSLITRTISLDNFSKCPNDEKNAVHFDGVITKITRNKYSVNGEFKFTDNAMGPIEVVHFNGT